MGKDEILNKKTDLEIKPCIYFLIRNNKIVYVGQANNVYIRIGQHHKTKDFDSFSYIECKEEEMNELETKYILEFEPFYNKKLPPNKRYKSLDHMKEEYGVNKWTLNDVIRKKNLKPMLRHYYDINDFKELA